MNAAFRFALLTVAASSGCWTIAGLQDRPIQDAADGGARDAGSERVLPETGPREGGRSCASHTDAPICDTFDEAVIDRRWSVETNGTGTVTLGAPGRSDPNAIVFYTPAGDPGARARIQRTISGGKLMCTFDVYYESLPRGGFEIAHFEVNGSARTAVLTVTNDGMRTGDASAPVTPPAPDVWVAYQLVIDVGASLASLTKNGGSAVTVPLGGYPTPETTTVSFGFRFIPGGEIKFRMDDVLCEIIP
jgi:hypothetical protein